MNLPVPFSQSISSCVKAQLLEEIERLFEPSHHQEAAPFRQLAHEQLEDRRLGLAVGQIGLDHIELVQVGEERT